MRDLRKLPTIFKIKYIPSPVAYFERMRQIEETAEHISVMAGPISSLRASDNFEAILEKVLKESIIDDVSYRERTLTDIPKIIAILRERKRMFWHRIGMQIGIVTETLPHTSFHIYRQTDRRVLVLSPFRLGEQPNISVGVAMITSAPEALAHHEKTVNEIWHRALKGNAAAYLGALLKSNPKSSPKDRRNAPSRPASNQTQPIGEPRSRSKR